MRTRTIENAEEIVQQCIDGERDPKELPTETAYSIYMVLSPNPMTATHGEVTEFKDRMAEAGIWEAMKPPMDFEIDEDELVDELER